MRAAIAAALAALVAAAGCGGGEREKVPSTRLVAAAEHTRIGPPQRLHVDVAVNAFATELRVTGDGVWDPQTGRGRMTLDMSDVAPLVGGPPGPGSDRADVRLSDRELSIRWAPLAQRIGSGGPWVRVAANPAAQAVDALRGLKGQAEVVGRDSIHGVPTTHYRGTADPKRFPGLPIAGDALPVDVWVGDETGRIHKLRVRAPVALPGGPGFDLDGTLELADGVRR